MRDKPVYSEEDTHCDTTPTKRQRSSCSNNEDDIHVSHESKDVSSACCKYERIVCDFERSATISRSIAVLSHIMERSSTEAGACDAFVDCGIVNVICLKVGYVMELQNNAFCESTFKNRIQNENALDDGAFFVKMAMESFYKLYTGCSARSLTKSLEKIGDEVLYLTTNILELQIGALSQVLWGSSMITQPDEMLGDLVGQYDSGWYINTVEHCLNVCSIVLYHPQGCFGNGCLGSDQTVSTNAINAVIQILTLVTLASSDQNRSDVSVLQSLKDDIFVKCIEILCNLVRRALSEPKIMQTLQLQISREKWGFILDIIRQLNSRCNRSIELRQFALDAMDELGRFQSTLKEETEVFMEKFTSLVPENESINLLHLLQALSPHAKNPSDEKMGVFLKVLRDDSSRSLRLMAATAVRLTVSQGANAELPSNLMSSIIRLSQQEPDRLVKVNLIEVATSIAAKMSPECDVYDENLQLLKELLYSDDMKFAEYAISAIYQQTLTPADPKGITDATKRTRIACCPELLDALASISSYLRVSLVSQKYIAEIFLNVSDDAMNGEQLTRSIILESLLDLASLPKGGRTVPEGQIIDRIHVCALSAIVRLARGVSNRRKLAKQPGLMLTLIRFVSNPGDQMATTAEDVSLQLDVKETLIKLTQAI